MKVIPQEYEDYYENLPTTDKQPPPPQKKER